MQASEPVIVQGFVADADTGAGLSGLNVEVWAGNGHGPRRMAVGRSDDAGLFRLRVRRDPLAADPTRPIDVEMRVLDGSRLVLSELRTLPLDDPPDISLIVPPAEAEDEAGASELDVAGEYEISGRIRGTVEEGATLQAVVKTLRDGSITERVVATTMLDSSGSYQLRYERPADASAWSNASLSVRLFSSEGHLLVESAPLLAPGPRTRINLRAPRAAGGPAEYDLIERRIGESLSNGAATLEGIDESAVDEISTWVDVDADRLQIFQQAQALGHQTGLPPAIFYAFGRNGTGVSLDDLVDVPIEELRTTIAEAAAGGIIDSGLIENADAIVDRLASEVVDQAVRPERDTPAAGLPEVLAAADIPREAVERTLRQYQKRGESTDFWSTFGEAEDAAEGIDEDTRREITTAVRLGGLVGPDPALLRHMHELRREGRWRRPEDLSSFTFDDWCDVVETVEPVDADFEEADADEAEIAELEEDRAELVEERAEQILDALEETFPNEFIRNHLAASDDLSAGARTLISRAPDHDFLAGSIRARADTDPSLLEGLEEGEAWAAMEEIEAVERISRVTPNADDVSVLVGTGMRSALDIGSMPSRQFIDLYGEALGGRPQAARVYADAQQVAAATKLTTLRLLQSLQHMPAVIGSVGPDIKNIPELRTLFRAAGGFCDCEHCGSVYSPAAYYVDLLRYLNVSSPQQLKQIEQRLQAKGGTPAARNTLIRYQYQPLDVLLNRRPDLADLPLTCENTLTPLPYIDLVNELLEAFITGESAAYDTGKTSADVLRAVPQHISREAYRRLQQAVHPLALPYHQPLSLARAYLGHLGVTRAELVRTLGRGEARGEALTAESLGMSPEEFGLVARPPAELWRHLGFASAEIGDPAASYVNVLLRAPALLEATGITFQTLIDLVSTRFLNSDNQLQLETPSPDCDPEIVRIVGLDEARLSRMLRLIRLQRRLGWPVDHLDKALVAFGATDLDAPVLEKLAIARDIAARLDRPLLELLVLWAPLDTWGKDNQFDKLFTTRAVAWQTQDERTFQLRPERTELNETGDQLDGVASALLAAFRITSEELALIRALQTRRGAAPRLDLAGLSAIYRVVILARALQLRISALDLLLRMTPPEANPFQPGDPAATRRFLDIVQEVQASDFTPERLAYLFRHEWEQRRDPRPLPAQVEAVLGSIRRGLSDAFSETSRPAEVTGDTLRQKLAAWLDPSLVDPAIEALDPRTPLTPAKRREFFDRYLGRIFADARAAAARLFGAPPETPQAAPATAPPETPQAAPPTAPPAADITAAPSPAASPATAPATAPTPAPASATEAGDAPASAPSSTVVQPPPPATAAPPAAPASDPLEARWVANIHFVLDNLLPQLRTRQLRGAVIQTLGDTLGLTAHAAARLLDTVMRSRRRPGEPLLADFLALLGRGLTGAYYPNAELSGEPAVVRNDPELTFSWAGAPPADRVPGRQFSVRWTGHLLARSKGPHTFYVQSDGAVRLTLKIGGNERVLIDQPTGTGRVVEHASEPVALDPAQLNEIRVEYRNQGGPAAIALQFGTGPAAKQVVPRTNLYPADGLTSFAPVEESYRRLHKAALVLTGFGVTDAQLEWLTGDPPSLNLDTLPTQPPPEAESVSLFRRWYQLARLYALRRKLPRSNADLFDVFRTSTMAEALDRLVLATGWERSVIDAFLGPEGLGIDNVTALRPPVDAVEEEPTILRLARAMDVQRRVGVAPATLYAWANAVPDADASASIVQSVKARYDETRWLEVARTLNDPLRAERRDALVAYLLPRMRELGVRNRNQLFEYFLIDVDMNPCMLTSRIRQATGAVQTFFQRCLMNLEPKVEARVINDKDWQWLKTYRVWEANRKVFLYPENWIEPELRDDKSPLFQALESSILQQEIKKENVEAAFADYLEGLDEISRLDVRGVWFEERERHRMVSRPVPKELRFLESPAEESKWDIGTYHVFARTFNAPYVWYYRRLENGRQWTAWEKIEVDIESDHLVPVVFQRRMHLFWTQFQEVTKPLPEMKKEEKGPPPPLVKDWEIHLAYSVYDRGRWSRKKMSAGGVIDDQTFATQQGEAGHTVQYDGSRALWHGDYTLRAQVTAGELPRLRLSVYCRAVERTRTTNLTLTPAEVVKVASFELKGCNGALVPDRARSKGRATILTRENRQLFGLLQQPSTILGNTRAQGSSHPFRLSDGGAMNAPAGYSLDGMSFVASRHAFRPDVQRRHRPAVSTSLAFPLGDARGTAIALPARPSRGDVQIVPVIDPAAPVARGLYPFFFQDSFRSYFVRPVDLGRRVALQRFAMPLFRRHAAPARRPAARPGLRPAARPSPAPRRRVRRRRGRGAREEMEIVSTWTPEAIDAWEDEQDEAWHPDDASEARRRRKRRAPPPPSRRTSVPMPAPRRRPAPARAPVRPVARVVRQVPLHYREEKLRFTPFEHLDTCHLIKILKVKGIDGLLDFKTTRPPIGKDHAIGPDGVWRLRRPSWFERHYGIGPLIDRTQLPHVDIAFESDSPYGLYNWELFFHAPLQVAIRLSKDGRHEEAQRWFHFIFDPTTDSSAPSPRRYWQFAPFYDNNEYASARELMQLLSYGGNQQEIIRRQYEVREQLSAWWEKPFSPHVIARLRIGAYQKAVVMKYIDNLIEWGDKLFRRDSMESIQEATQIYILAANILGPRPEKIPPIVSKEPLTFQRMRHGLDLFSNFEVRLENLQVRRPFRVNARPDSGAAASVLSMATLYFCTPPNPQLDKYWDTVADRLFKIRNCMNIQGIVRQLALFEPPIDPGLLVRAAAAGVDLGSVIASLNAPPPHYRFRFLLGRAVRLAEEIRTFGAMTLQVLERRDAEALSTLRASNETALLNALRDVRKKQVRQVEEALGELSAQREHIELQIQHLNAQLQMLMNPQEIEKQKSLSAAQVLSGVQQGIELVSKVMHAIPEFQTGAAGGFSSPFVTLQLGGQMFGEIASAFASSVESVMSQKETAASLAEAQAEYQRRREEWQHELDLLNKEKAKVDKKIAETNLKLEIASSELKCHDIEVENSRKVQLYFREKYTSEQLYGWMLGQLSTVYFQAYKVAFDAAQQAERAFRFERADSSSSFIEFSYWDSLKKGLLAGERLLLDLRRMESAHVEGDRRSLEVTRHISLRDDFPLAWVELLATGRCQIEASEALLDGDFPGHYFRRIKTVSLTVSGVRTPHRNINCTVTLLENRIRTNANASGAYAQASDGEDSRFSVNPAPIQAIATSKPDADPGMFQLRFDDERYLPFEGAGAISAWRLELPQADNALSLGEVGDVVLSLSYTAKTGGAALEAVARAEREKGLARGGIKPEPQHLVSLKRDFPDIWKRLADTPAGQEVELPLPLPPELFSGRYRGLDLRVERVTAFAHARGELGADALKLRLDPPKGSGTPAGGWAPPWPRSRVVRATAEVSGPVGQWKLAVTAVGGKVTDLVDDLVLVFDLRARRK